MSYTQYPHPPALHASTAGEVEKKGEGFKGNVSRDWDGLNLVRKR